MPADCLVIDGVSALPHVDIVVVDIAPIGILHKSKICGDGAKLTLPRTGADMHWGDEGWPYFVGELPLITMHNSLITWQVHLANVSHFDINDTS